MFIRTAIAVFVAATIIQTGAAFAQTAPQQGPPPGVTAPAGGHHHRDRMAIFRGLNLSAGQTAKIKEIRKKYHAQNKGVTDPQARRANMQAQRSEIMGALTPDQQQKFQQRLTALRNHRRDRQAPPASSPTQTR